MASKSKSRKAGLEVTWSSLGALMREALLADYPAEAGFRIARGGGEARAREEARAENCSKGR